MLQNNYYFLVLHLALHTLPCTMQSFLVCLSTVLCYEVACVPMHVSVVYVGHRC